MNTCAITSLLYDCRSVLLCKKAESEPVSGRLADDENSSSSEEEYKPLLSNSLNGDKPKLIVNSKLAPGHSSIHAPQDEM